MGRGAKPRSALVLTRDELGRRRSPERPCEARRRADREMTHPGDRVVVAPGGLLYPPGRLDYWKSSLVRELSNGAIETLIDQFAAVPSPYSVVAHEHLAGAMDGVCADETAFGHRDAPHSLIVTGEWADPPKSARNVAWVRPCWEAMRPFTREGVYVNYVDADQSVRLLAAYGARYERLVALPRLAGGVWEELHTKLLN